MGTSITISPSVDVLPGGLSNPMIVTKDTFENTLLSLPKTSEFIIDVETNGLDPYNMNQLCGIGLTNMSDSATYYFPFRHQSDEPNLSQSNLEALVAYINEYCKTLIGYNVKFDAKFLENEGINIDSMKLVDVLVMVRMTEPTTINQLSLTDTINRSYGEEAGQYDIDTKQVLRKNKWNKDFSLSPPSVLGPYCIKDVEWTRRVYTDRLVKLEETKQTELFKFQCELTKTLYDMEKRGVPINNQYAKVAHEKMMKRIADLKLQVHELAGQEFNISSPKQIGEIFNGMGVHSPARTGTGAEAWNEAVLVQLNNPLAGMIRQYRTLVKYCSTYIEPYLEMPVLHTNFCNWGTVTGRLSSRNPNLQNIPRDVVYVEDRQLTDADKVDIKDRVAALISSKGGNSRTELTDDVIKTWSFLGGDKFNQYDPKQVAIRHLFIPRPGYKMVAYDYSQMEVRVFMYYVNNDEMNELMKQENVDFHGEAAKIAFNIEESDPQFKFFRQLAKSITFGVIYGIGRDKLSMQLNTTPIEAANYKTTYLNNMKGSKRFFDAVVRTIKTRGTVRSRYNRIYKVPADFAYRGVNYLIQGTSADIMSERMVEVHKYLQNKKSNLLLQVHDEIICEIHEDEFDEVADKVKELMIVNTLNIPLEVDMEICDPSWAIKKDADEKETNIFKLEEHIDWS